MSKQTLRSQITSIREERDNAIESKASKRRIETLNAKLSEVTRKYRESLKNKGTKKRKAAKRVERASKTTNQEAAEFVREFFALNPRTKLTQLRDAKNAERRPAKRVQREKALRDATKIYRFMIEQREALGA